MVGNKYHARRAQCGTHSHPSLKERARCYTLQLLEQQGVIGHLRRATRFRLVVNGQEVGVYTDDFDYIVTSTDEFVVEDVKGGAATRTEAYQLRKRLVKACLGLTIREV